MGHARRFDWDEAKALRALGWSYPRIGERYGVSASAVWLAVNDEGRERQARRSAEWQASGTCEECGGPATRYSDPRRRSRCVRCWNRYQTAVRDGRAWCSVCLTWKPLDDFTRARDRPVRGVRNSCRSCDTRLRREHRHANREASNRYERERKRLLPGVRLAHVAADGACRECGALRGRKHRVSCVYTRAYRREAAAA